MVVLLLFSLLLAGALSQDTVSARPTIKISPSDITVHVGALIHLPCEAQGDPKPTIEWFIGRSQLRNPPVIPDDLTKEEIRNYAGGNFLVTEKGHLYARDVTAGYSAQYVCVATNDGGRSWATSRVLVLDPPKITTRPQDTNSLDADVIGIACRANGNPNPKITWRVETFENITIVEPENHPSGRYETDAYKTLRIRFPLPSDSGKYICVATNAGGVAEASAILQVLITPQFREPPKDAWVPFGGSAVFSCSVFGSPTPVIEWFKDNQYLPFSQTYEIQHVTRPGEVQERLVFRSVQFEDTGFYECRASNLAGTSRHEFSLAVTDATPFPGDRFVSDALDYAQEFVQSAIQETQIILKARFNAPNFNPTPQDLFHMVRQPTRQALYMAMSAEVFEHAMDYIHEQIEALNVTSMERNNVPLGSLLSPEAIDHLEDLSGCHRRKRQPKCQMRCQGMSFRSHDGTCNNIKHPTWGSSLNKINRFLPALYENKYNTPRGWGRTLPSARMISQRLIRTHTTKAHSQFSVLMMHFGQFVDHDLAQTVAGPSETSFAPFLRVRCEQTCTNTMPCFPIEVHSNDSRIDAACMPFVRSASICGTGDTSVFGKETRVREQLNQVTSFLDASTVYGSADQEMETLRDRSANKGQLRVGEESIPGKHFLPIEDNLIPEEMESDRRCIGRAATVFLDCFIAGDFRVTEQPGLTTLHTLFMRQHNEIAYNLAEVNPQWNDDRIYEEARKIIGGVMQHITYQEYLPKVLGVEGMEQIGDYTGYDSDVDASLLNEFSTAAFRFGHTLIPPTLFRRGENYDKFKLGDMPLHNSFFTPYRLLDEGGVDPIIRGMIVQNLKLPDGKLSDSLTERLFNVVAQVALDLAAINIQRGRDHAIPTYNDMRQVCGMRRALDFHDLQGEIRNATTRQLLSELYSSVDEIDLWVGGLEEDIVEGGLVGPTFRCIIAEQFKRVRDGDRFWFESDKQFTQEQIRQIKKITMAKVFCDSGDKIEKVPVDVFMYNSDAQKFTQCKELPKFDYSVFVDCGDKCDHRRDGKDEDLNVSCYEDGSDEKAKSRALDGAWPTRGRSGETIRLSNDLVLRREEHRKFLENLDLPQKEIDIRLTNWDELVQEVTFGGDRSRAHQGGKSFNRKSRTRRRFTG